MCQVKLDTFHLTHTCKNEKSFPPFIHVHRITISESILYLYSKEIITVYQIHQVLGLQTNRHLKLEMFGL